MFIGLKEFPYWCSHLIPGIAFLSHKDEFILRICPLVGATLVLPLAHLKKKIGLGCFVSGTAVDANEITLFRDFQDVCGKEMPELSRDGCSSQSWCGRSCPVCSCARGCSTLSLRQVISLICVIYLLLLCYFIIFLDSFKLITAATWHVIKANNSWDYACLSGLVFETQIVLFTLFLLAQTCAFLADRWLHRW